MSSKSKKSDSTDASAKPQPRALLFDIGGVCVESPMAAIAAWEKRHNLPKNWINFAISRSGPEGAWSLAETGQIPLDSRFFAAFGRDLSSESAWREYTTSYASRLGSSTSSPGKVPITTAEDAEAMFWEMMTESRQPDRYIAPALHKLRASGQYLIAALSNTTIFPPGHPFNEPREDDPRMVFDVFVSSAHEGLRKPDPLIYELAMQRMRAYFETSADTNAKSRLNPWNKEDRRAAAQKPAFLTEPRVGDTLQPSDVLFLDDIGANLKAARNAGFRTIKVSLGRTQDAVRELERVTGMKLLEGSDNDEKARI